MPEEGIRDSSSSASVITVVNVETGSTETGVRKTERHRPLLNTRTHRWSRTVVPRTRTGCLLHLSIVVHPLDDEALEELQAQERAQAQQLRHTQRRKRHRHPACRSYGPLRPKPWERVSEYQRQDRRPTMDVAASDLETWTQQVLQQAQYGTVEDVLSSLVLLIYHGDLASRVTHKFAGIAQQSFDMSAARAHLALQEAIRLWGEAHLQTATSACLPVTRDQALETLQAIRANPASEHDFSLSRHTQRTTVVNNLWDECDPVTQIRRQLQKESMKQYHFPSVVHRWIDRTPVFLYVFSGRRRQGDYQEQVEKHLRVFGITGWVLLLDLAISPDHDVADPTLVANLIRWLRDGYIASLLVAPPCESWSEVRNEPVEGETGPRPLRTSHGPFGISGLTHRELQQVCLANFLLFVSIRFFAIATIHGVPALMERPKQPKKSDRASIWRLEWLERLFQEKLATKTLVWQAWFGAPSPKPTHLAHSNIHDFHGTIQMMKQPVDWDSLQHLSGKSLSGCWKTTAAKEYLARMNEALSYMQV